MKKIFNNVSLINCINILIILFIFSFILFNLRYSIVINCDLHDYINYSFEFFHGRIINELISFLFIIKIPSLLNIPIQNFAFVSEGVTKTIFFCTLVYLSLCSYNKFQEKPIIFSLILSISPFLILSILNKLDFIWSFKFNEYYTGYISSIIFYLLFWYKLAMFYINTQKFSQKDYLLLPIFVILTVMSNEMLYVSAVILLFLLCIDSFFIKKTSRYLVSLFILIFSFSIYTMFQHGTTDLVSAMNISFNFSPSIDIIIAFVKLFLKYIFVKNILLFIPFVINLFILLFLNENKEKNLKVIKYVLFSLFGFIVFIVGTLFLSLNCYCTDEKYKFWFLHKGLLSTFGICLYCISLYLTGYIFSASNEIKNKIITIVIFISTSLLHIFIFYIPFEIESFNSYKQTKEMLYIVDKMSVHYLKQNKMIILPNDLPFEIIDVVDPHIIATDVAIYSQKYTKEKSSYLDYIEKEYKVNTEKGVTFLNNDAAMKHYIDNGGTFTDEELDKLDFSYIKKSLNEE